MTHSIKTIGTVLAAALLATLALAGCKKEEPTSSFLLVGDSSIYFEYGQTKEVFYTTRNIASFYLPSVPEGWSCVRQSGKYVITAPSEGDSGALSEGDIRVSADAGDRRITRTITVAIRLAEEIVAPANSFIVSEPGKRYKFNARRRAGETAETLDATGANIMWVTAGAPVGHVSLENGYLYFATADGAELIPGNALVAATDKTGKVLWSWHIWVTDYDPAVDYHTAAGAKVMARNLGALAGSNASAEDVRDSYGLYYQWGRKDPFPGPAAWNSTATEPLFTSLGRYTNLSFATSSDETGTLEYIASRPMTFIAGTEENDYAWLWDDSDDTLWGGSEGSGDSGAKTIYDPCPAGWRVASSDIWEGFVSGATVTDPAAFNVVGEYDCGWTFEVDGQQIYYPAAGRRSFSPTLADIGRNYTNIVNDENGVGLPVGFYWSSDSPGVHSLAFDGAYINPGAAPRRNTTESAAAGGFPLRCVEE